MYFLVNESPPELFDKAIFKLYRCIVHIMQRVLGHIFCDLDLVNASSRSNLQHFL